MSNTARLQLRTSSGCPQVFVSVTSTPWKLQTSALVISVGENRNAGDLARSFREGDVEGAALWEGLLRRTSKALLRAAQPVVLKTRDGVRPVIFATGSSDGQRPPTIEGVTTALRAVWNAATEQLQQVTSIALPLINSGQAGLDRIDVAEATLLAIATFGSGVEFVIFDRDPQTIVMLEQLAAGLEHARDGTPIERLHPDAIETIRLAISAARSSGRPTVSVDDVVFALAWTISPDAQTEMLRPILQRLRDRTPKPPGPAASATRMPPVDANLASALGHAALESRDGPISQVALLLGVLRQRETFIVREIDPNGSMVSELMTLVRQGEERRTAEPRSVDRGPVAILGRGELQPVTSASRAHPDPATTAVRRDPIRHRPGFRPDAASTTDALGLARDVEAIASLMIAREVEPPLSIGLFGNWGSGKSTFMRLVQERIDGACREAKLDPKSPFCEHVVQLQLDAWHYADSKNLWATLTVAIFEQLAEKTRQVFPEQHDKLVEVLKTTKVNRDEKLAAVADAKSKRRQAEVDLEKLHRSEERLSKLLTPAKVVEAVGATLQSLNRVEDKKKLDAAAEKLGIDKDKAPQDRSIELAGLRSIWGALFLFLKDRAPLLVASGTVACVAAALWIWSGATARLSGLAKLALPVVVWATPWIVGAIRACLAVRPILAIVGAAREERIRVIAGQRDILQAAVVKAEQEFVDAEKEVSAAERALEDLRPDRALISFITERHDSSEYRAELGVIARVQRDFRLLAEKLREARKARAATPRTNVVGGASSELPPIDRIVLYIDDLDRCPSDQVMIVLQAVHLLLAFDLFVVVVGVDARWLESAVMRHAAEVGAHPDTVGAGLRPRLALDYLEKIFQIPFVLPRMSSATFASLISSLSSIEPPTPQTPSSPQDEKPTGSSASPLTGPTSSFVGTPTVVQGAPVSAGSPVVPSGRREVELRMLSLAQHEREFISKLEPLLPTPRAVKRLVNLYMLVKMTLPDTLELDAFVGSKDAGEHRAVAALLALTIGHPELAALILEGLRTKSDERNFGSWLMAGKWSSEVSSAAETRRTTVAIETLRLHVAMDPLASFAKYAERIERHSIRSRW